MQPRNYFTDAASWFLKRNPEPQLLSGAEYNAVKERVEHWVKNGICFTLPTSGKLLSDEDLKKVGWPLSHMVITPCTGGEYPPCVQGGYPPRRPGGLLPGKQLVVCALFVHPSASPLH